MILPMGKAISQEVYKLIQNNEINKFINLSEKINNEYNQTLDRLGINGFRHINAFRWHIAKYLAINTATANGHPLNRNYPQGDPFTNKEVQQFMIDLMVGFSYLQDKIIDFNTNPPRLPTPSEIKKSNMPNEIKNIILKSNKYSTKNEWAQALHSFEYAQIGKILRENKS